MNESMLLNWLLQDAEKHGDRYYGKTGLEEALKETNNQQENPLPASLPKSAEKMIPVLREHFKDNVTFISLVLNHHFPEKYLFYRVSKLEEEIFEGVQFFSEIVPEFAPLQFPRIGKTRFSRYRKLNQVLFEFARTRWPKHKNPHETVGCQV
jgi:hypothetical protein